jgi:hypothetical protein
MFYSWQVDEKCGRGGSPPLPAAWSVEDIGAAFVVKDSNGQKLGYFYYED